LLSISDQDQAIHDQKSSSSHRPHQYQPRLSDEQREEIALMFVDQGMKAREIIEVFKRRGIRVPKSTLYDIRYKLRYTGSFKLNKERHRPAQYTPEQLKYVADLQNEHNEWTYQQIRRAWQEHFQISKKLSDWTIHRALNLHGFTSKNLTLIPESRDDPATIEERRKYCLKAAHWPRDAVIFIDEVGFTRNQKRTRGISCSN